MIRGDPSPITELITAVKEWRYAREAVLAHQLEFEKTKKGMEVTSHGTVRSERWIVRSL
jgi:hypothetical protein